MTGRTLRVDLHIGVEKTGTTTIQNALRASRDELARQGVLYPSSLGHANHMALAIIGRGDDVRDDLRQRRGLTTPAEVRAFRAETADKLRAEVEAADVDRVVLSNEHCSSRLLSTQDVRRLRDWLRTTLHSEPNVLVYLRRQDRMVESRHSTVVRYGVAEDLHLPSDHELATLYDFEALLHRWESEVGGERLQVRRFERSRLRGGDVVKDFTTALDLPAIPSPDEHVNTALDAPTQRFAAMLNRHVPRFTKDGHNELHAQVVQALDAVTPSGGPERLSDQDARALMDRVRPGNDAVATAWFDGPPLFAAAASPPAPQEELDLDRAVALAGHVLQYVANGLERAQEHQVAKARAELRVEARRREDALQAEVEEAHAELLSSRRRTAAAERERDEAQAELLEMREERDAARKEAAALERRARALWQARSHRLGRALVHPIRTLREDSEDFR